MKFSLLTVALATSVSASFFDRVHKRDAMTVENDIANISTQVQTLTAALNAFTDPNSSDQLTAIIEAEMNLDAAINKGTADTEATPASSVTEADGDAVLNAVNALIPGIVDALNAATGKMATFGALYGVVVSDLAMLHTDTDNFANALIAVAPADLVTAANSAKACIDAAFNAAQASPPQTASASCAAPPIPTTSSGGPTSAPTSVPTTAPPTTTFPSTTAPVNGTSIFPTTSVPKNGTTSVPPTSTAPGGGSTCPPGGSGVTTTVTTCPGGSGGSGSTTTVTTTSVSTVTVTGGGGGSTTTCPSNSKCTKAANVYEVMANADSILSNWVCSF